MRAAHFLRKYRESINPPYSRKDVITILATILIFLAIPLTVFVINQAREYRSRAGGTPAAPWYINPESLVILRSRQVCPLLTLPNDGNIVGQDGGNSTLAGSQSFWTFGDTLLTSGAMPSNNVAMATDLDAADCIDMTHKQSGGYAQLLLPPDTTNPIRAETIVWPNGMASVQSGVVHFYYDSGGPNGFGDPRGVGLAKFNTATWNTVNAQRVTSVFWEYGDYDINGDGQKAFKAEGASAFVDGNYVYLFFGQKVGRVPKANIENIASYTFWNGSAWVSDLKQAVDLWSQDYINGLGVSYNSFLGKYVAVYSDTFDVKNGVTVGNFRNYIRLADSITGPWSEQITIEDCVPKHKLAAGWLLCYAGRQHEEYAKNGGQTIYFTDAVSDEDTSDPIGGRLYLHELIFGTPVYEWDLGGNSLYKLDGDTVPGGTKKGIVFYASKFSGDGLVAINQWFNSSSGEYVYQPNLPGAGFANQGTAFYLPDSATEGMMPVYRWDKVGDAEKHVYTPLNIASSGYTRGPKVFYGKLTDPVSVDAAGFDLLTHPEKIGTYRPSVITKQVSSHNKAGNNIDVGHDNDASYYLYQEAGKYVIFDEKGPGTVTRIWVAGAENVGDSTRIQFYFDDQTAPRYDFSLNELFSGIKRPFVSPFVANLRFSSGGNFSYLPIQFAERLKIVVTAYPAFYYNIGYEKYGPWDAVSSLTDEADFSAAAQVWQNTGLDPKPTSGNTSDTGTVDVPAGSTKTLFQKAGSGSVNAIKLTIPQIVSAPIKNIYQITDDGRAHTGSSEFTVRIDPNNSQVRLKRRLDAGIAGQTADVYVDGVKVGQWKETIPADLNNRWRDSLFTIPAANTAGKSQIKIKIQFVSSSVDWNEFYYWVLSKVGDSEIVTDELDVGDAISQFLHGYTITGQTWEGVSSGPEFEYPPVSGDSAAQNASREVLAKTRIKIYWDGEAVPSVDAPLGAFFGSYAGAAPTRSLMFGMDPEAHTFYSYFPMPYDSNVKIELENGSGVAISSVAFNIATNSTKFGAEKFHATFNKQEPVETGKDYKLLEASGKGQVVGSILFMHGLPYLDIDRAKGFLEGDERFHIDGSQAPSIYGTGTEDYFNSGFYFNRGFVNRPASGYNLNLLEGSSPNTLTNFNAYRINLADPISFRSGIKMGIEHGDPGGYGWENLDSTWPANYYSLVFWYGQGTRGLFEIDSVDMGNSTSESDHSYQSSGTSAVSGNYTYEGDDDSLVSDNGRQTVSGGWTQFQIKTVSDATIILRRRFDAGVANQEAEVQVDGLSLGVWRSSGQNTARRWSNDEFIIPSQLTKNKASITIKIISINNWTAYNYWINSSLPGTLKPGDLDGDGDVDILDLSRLITNWGASGGVADINGDGLVDVYDLSILLSNWGT